MKIRYIGKMLLLFLIGGATYILIELLWRGHTHWTMASLGGLCFLLIGGINNWIPWEMPIWKQCLIGACVVTALELVFGIILNIWLGLGIWDYTFMPGNFLGQICPQFFMAWVGVSFLAILFDDWLRYKLFKEDKPHYTWKLK